MELKRTETFKKEIILNDLDLSLKYVDIVSKSSIDTNLLFDENPNYSSDLIIEIMEILKKYHHLKNIKLEFLEKDFLINTKELDLKNDFFEPEIDLPFNVKPYKITLLESLNLNLEDRDSALAKAQKTVCHCYYDGQKEYGNVPKNIIIEKKAKKALITLNPNIGNEEKIVSHFFQIDFRRPCFFNLFNQLLFDSEVSAIELEYYFENKECKEFEQFKKIAEKGFFKKVQVFVSTKSKIQEHNGDF